MRPRPRLLRIASRAMIRRPGRRLLILVLLAAGLPTLVAPQASAQPGPFSVVVTFPPYELIYLRDFTEGGAIDPRGALRGVRADVANLGPAARVAVCAELVFRTDADEENLLLRRCGVRPFGQGEAATFDADSFAGARPIGSDPDAVDALNEDARGLRAVPVREYVVRVGVVDPQTGERYAVVGPSEVVVPVRYGALEEAQVAVLAPADGATVADPTPVFNLLLPPTNPEAQVRLQVFPMADALTPEEALSRAPVLDVLLGQGQQAYVYGEAPVGVGASPPPTPRVLREGETYVVAAAVAVQTSRGETLNYAPLTTFTRAATRAPSDFLTGLLYQLGGEVPTALDGLATGEWVPEGEVLLDGRALSVEELARLVAQLRERGVEPRAAVERPEQ